MPTATSSSTRCGRRKPGRAWSGATPSTATGWFGSITVRWCSTTTPSRAGWTRPPARGRPSSTGWLARRSGWLQVEHRNGRRAWCSQGLDFDRPAPVDGDVALGHVVGSEPLAGHFRAAEAIDLIQATGGLDEVLDVFGEKTRNAGFDQLGG